MLLNLSGAHGPFFTRNLLILNDSAGRTGIGEVPGGEKIRRTLEEASSLVVGQPIGAQQQVLLPEGWYLLEANRNGKITKHTIQITAGLNYAYTLLEQ